MFNTKLHPARFQSRNGAMLPLIAVVMIIMIVGAVFSVDIAYMHMVRAELRTATDAAARAGAEVLARTQDPDQAIQAAIDVAERNIVSGNGLTLNRDDIVLGSVQLQPDGSFDFVADQEPLTSVHVVGHRDSGAADGPVPLFFGGMLGRSTFQPLQTATASSSVRDIALILDRSGSMGTRMSGGGTRLTALQAAVDVFIDEVEATSPNSLISLTTYSTRSSRDIALTDDFDQIRRSVSRLRASGMTNIFQALRQGSDSLHTDPRRRPFADRTIVLMTDGNFNEGGTPIPSAHLAAGRNHVIHTITFSSGANQRIMRDVANIGGGQHIHADDAEDLEEAFRAIARSLAVFLSE